MGAGVWGSKAPCPPVVHPVPHAMLSASAHHPGEAIRPGAGPARKIVSAYALRQAGSTGTHKANERPRRASASPPTRNAHPRRTSDAPPKRSVRPRDLVKVGKRSAARCRPGRMPQPEHGCMAPPHKCRTPSVSGGRGWLIGSTEGQSLLFCLQKTRPATAYDSARISKRETWHQTTGIGSATGGEKKPATLNGPVSECRG